MSKVIDSLITNFKKSGEVEETGDRIKVHNVVGAAAFAYEKVRNAVDYMEEHLLRKNAIYRILKRKLGLEKMILENYLLDKYHHDNIAEQLLQELLRGKYFKVISKKKIEEIDKIIRKYNKLLASIKDVSGHVNKKYHDALLQFAAVEIEQNLMPPTKEKALSRVMFSVMNTKIKVNDENVNQKEKELQIYVNCYRSLYKWDDATLTYLLFTLYYPQWESSDEKLIKTIANKFEKIYTDIEKQVNHPWRKHIIKILNKNAIIFHVLSDVVEKDVEKAKEVFDDPELLENEIKKACNKRYKAVRVKLRRGVVRSIIYVFLTKMVLAIALEFPFDYYIEGAINYTTAGINILFPPILMLVVAVLIRMPKKENTEYIVDEIKSIGLRGQTKKKYVLKSPKPRKTANFIFKSIYFLTFIFSIMVIFWVLNKFDFNMFSSLIFVLFLTLVSFFGIRIRRPVKDLLAIEKRDNFLTVIIDFFALPFVSMGKWMSTKFSKINFFALFLDVIIEAPFKLLIEVIEDMFGFIKEKKDEVMNDSE